jgi:predicted nucleic acid-binding protein
VNGSFIPDHLHLIDTSALARAKNPAVAEIIGGLIIDRTAATCITIDLDVGYSARSHAEMLTIDQYRKANYYQLPLRQEITDRAKEIQTAMAKSGHHRAAGVFDILTAATADFYRATIVHYDADFEHIAATTGQPHRWITPRGSLD